LPKNVPGKRTASTVEARRRAAILAELDRESPQSRRQLRKAKQIKGNAQAVSGSVAALVAAGELEDTPAGLVRLGGTQGGTLDPVRSENVPVRTTQNVPAERTGSEDDS
jgi:hypothetical protein